MNTARIVTLLPAIAFATLAAPQAAHAGRFPLFIILSTNPWMMGLGVVLVILWFVFRTAD